MTKSPRKIKSNSSLPNLNNSKISVVFSDNNPRLTGKCLKVSWTQLNIYRIKLMKEYKPVKKYALKWWITAINVLSRKKRT
jgi:hypothetical protein